MANKGKTFEEVIEYQNTLYTNRGVSTVQKIPTPWVVQRRYGQIVSAYPEKKSTVDYRGAVRLIDGKTYAISFDAKETSNESGLPLRNIEQHQIDFIKNALSVGELAFIVCSIVSLNKFFFIHGLHVLKKYELWQQNKGKKGYNNIPICEMVEIPSTPGNICDYLAILNDIVEVDF
jgi:recombination protein U